MKTITLSELKDKIIGKVGMPKRDKYEQELEVEILAETGITLEKLIINQINYRRTGTFSMTEMNG